MKAKTGGSIYRLNENNESFSSSISRHHTKLIDKIRALKVINDLSSETLEKHLASLKEKHRKKVDKLNMKERMEYDSLGFNIVGLSVPGSGIEEDVNIENHKVGKIMSEETEMYNHREHVRRASKEMTLVYLVIVFEEYITGLLSSLFRKRPEILKSSEKNIPYWEAFQCTDLNELLKEISKKEVRSRIELGIDGFNDYLVRNFKLDLRQNADWGTFKEVFYRRNIVVHNYGIPDSKYISKTNFKGRRDEWLEIDNRYINEAFAIFEKYSDEIAHFFHKKYGSHA
jgi:hypothetical protein